MIGPGISGALAVGTGIWGALRKDRTQGPSYDDIMTMRNQVISERTAQINSFSQALTSARMKYMAQLPQFQQYTMSRFLPQLEATYAGRGLQVSGGAFGSAVGQRAADFTQEQMLEQYNREREDVSTIDTANQGLFGAKLSSIPGSYAQPVDREAQLLGRLSAAFGQMAWGGGREETGTPGEATSVMSKFRKSQNKTWW